MTGTMAQRPRLTIDTAERHRRAFHLWAASQGLSVPEAFARLVESHMQPFLAIADQALTGEAKPHGKGRPPKAK
jgi:hypothetical protein